MPTESCEKILTVNKSEISIMQNMVECKLTAMEQKVEKLLCSTQNIEVNSCEVLLGEANVTGKVTVDIVYLTPDNEIDQSSSSFSFQTKLESDKFTPNMVCRANCKIVDCKLDSISEDELKYNIAIETKVDGYIQNEIDVALAGEDCCCKRAIASVVKLQKSSSSKLVENICLEIKDKIRKILKVDVQTICKDAEAGNGYITVNGEDIISVLYIEDDVDPKLKTYTSTKPFNEEIEIGSITKDSMLDCYIDLNYENLKNTLENKEEGSVVNINREATLNVVSFENVEFGCISDVYSLTHSTFVSTNSYSYILLDKKQFFQNKIDGTVSLSEDAPRIDKVLQNCGNQLKIISSYIQEDEIIVQGVVTTTVIYLNDETGTMPSVEVEIPFECHQRVGDVSENSQIDVQCAIDNVDVVAKRGKDVFVEAEIKCYASIYSTQTGAVISNIEMNEELPPKDSAMEIYFATEGQTLWDIAKDMIEDVDNLALLNPDLPEVMTGDEKIVCYRKKTINI